MNFDAKVKEAFNELNKKLEKEGVTLTVICVGGFVLSQYGLRTTKDIDGFFKSTAEIDKAIKTVGDKLGLNTEDELWLNNSVQNLNRSPAEDICDVLYDFSNLKVLMPPLEYIAGMKLKSARGQDIKDVADIIKLLKADDPLSFIENLQTLGFFEIDISLVLEAFGTAYGMSWLEKYYIDNEKAILEMV
ncbi:MAG TPA: potassium transporter peripheral membrane component [Mogibacterium sp.]|nr:potassium transporter peripheral membrane component [Mogibacterium sp.]